MRNDVRDKEAPHGTAVTTTADLLAELGRRFRLRYGRIEIVFHDGKPSPRVTVEHRMQRGLSDD